MRMCHNVSIKFVSKSNGKCVDEEVIFNFSGMRRQHTSSEIRERERNISIVVIFIRVCNTLLILLHVFSYRYLCVCLQLQFGHTPHGSQLKMIRIRILREFKWMRLKLDAKHVSYSVSFNSPKQFLLNAIITSMIMANVLSIYFKSFDRIACEYSIPLHIRCVISIWIMNKSNLMQ